jgi:MFS family permease
VPSALRSNPPLRRLLGAWLQSCVGSWAGYVALLLLTVRYLHNSWGVMAVLLAEFVPAVAFGAFFGACADRYSRRALIVTANLLQAAAWGGLAFAHTAASILTLALLAGIGNALQRPAMRAALPVVAGEAQQVAAAWFDTCRWAGFTVGPLLAAGMFAVAGLALPLALNGASFLVAALVLGTLAMERPAPQPQAQERGAGLREGLAVAFAAPGVAAVVLCSAAAVISGGLLNVCEPLFAKNVLHGSSSDYALLVACYGAGMVTGSVLVARRGDAPGVTIMRRYLASLFLSGLGMAGSALAGSVAPATVAFAATGYANALLVVSETQLIQLRVPNSVQGRLFGSKDTIEGAFFLIGLVAAAALIAANGVRVTLAVGAGVYIVCMLAAAAALWRHAGRAAGPLAPFDFTGEHVLDAHAADATLAHAQPRRFDPVAVSGEEASRVGEPRAPV